MRKIVFIMFFTTFFMGCSNNEESNSGNNGPATYFKLTIDGVENDLLNTTVLDAGTDGKVEYNGQIVTIGGAAGDVWDQDSRYQIAFYFTPDGKFLQGSMLIFSNAFQNLEYSSYREFSSYFCQVDQFDIDEINKIATLKYTVRYFIDETDTNSYSREIKADIKVPYIESDPSPTPYPYITYGGIEQYCKADINGEHWEAKYEREKSVFTNEGPYKFEINFANSPNPASYNFESSSTSNYVKFAKFNTTTMTYDYYNVSGQVGYSYREFHGGNNYSFIGSFSFTAVNPLNPTDVIHVTNGTFRSYQHF